MNDNMEEDIMKMGNELEEFFNNDALDILGIEATNMIKDSFNNEGFEGNKWKKRKTKDKKGRDKTRYRTNRVGKKGTLNKFGSENKGRAVLMGLNSDTEQNHLEESFDYEKIDGGVEIISNKEYAEIHNKGIGKMPERQFFKVTKKLNRDIEKKLNKTFDKIFE
jgi:phage gpG-like protein